MEGVSVSAQEGLLSQSQNDDDGGEGDELFVNTEGHCFLCLVKLEGVDRGEEDEEGLEEFGGGPSVQVPKSVDKDESFQCLSRYLKLDFGRGWRRTRRRRGRCKGGGSGVGAVGGDEGRKLKVPLCEVCTSISDQFLEVYRKLEQIELEMASCLTRVREKIVKAEETRLSEWWRSWRGRRREDELSLSEEDTDAVGGGAGRGLEFVEKLRKETVEKCLQKLNTLSTRPLPPPVPVSPTGQNRILKEERSNSAGFDSEDEAQPLPLQEDQDDDDDLPDDPDPGIFLEVGEDSSASSECENFSDHDYDFPGEGDRPSSISSRSSDSSRRSSDGDDNDDPDFSVSVRDPLLGMDQDEPEQESTTAAVKVPSSPTKKSPELGKHKCNLCSKLFRDSGSLKTHHSSIHLNISFSCPLCDKEFRYRRSYRRHHQEVHQLSIINCLKCQETFDRKSELKKHLQMSPSCREGQAVDSEENHQGEGSSISNQLPKPLGPKHTCRLCGRQFTHSGHLKRHMNVVHLKIRQFQCDQCHKQFSRTEHLQRHVDTVHLKLRPDVCDQCGKGFPTTAHLQAHVIAIHTELPRSFICDQCGKGYTSALNVRRHMEKVHLAAREIPCDICGEIFEGRRHLKSHRRKVHNEVGEKKSRPAAVKLSKPRVRKPCPCTICGKILSRRAVLNRHMEAVHYQLRKYACDKCSKSYKRKPDLLKHNCNGQVSPS